MKIKTIQIASFDKKQKDALKAIIKKIESGKKINNNDLYSLIDIYKIPQKILSQILNKSVQSIHKWVRNGCPQNNDNTYNFSKVIEWLFNREIKKYKTEDSLEVRKKEAEIKYTEAKISKIESEYIKRSDHELFICSMANSLKNFLLHSMPLNDHRYVNKNLDEIRVLRNAEIKQMMDAFTGGMPIED